MTEKQVKDKLIKALEARGYYTVLLVATNKSGIADVLAFKPGHVALIEVKRESKKGRDLQLFRLAEQGSYADVCAVYDGTQDIDEILAGNYNVRYHNIDPLNLGL